MQPETHHVALVSSQEQQVGIQLFISKGDPIPAVTKYLLTDFIVNEIAENGQVIMLKQKPNLQQSNNYKKLQEKVSYQMNHQLEQQIVNIFGKQAAQTICELYKKLDSGEKVSQWQHTIQNMPAMTKQQRIKIHTFVRQKLTNIQSNTLDGNKMKLKLNKKMRKINPASRNKYTHFTLFKSNLDTMGAIFKLSKITGINQKLFSTAGLKDKRGVTTQLVSVYNTDLSMLQKFYNVANRNKQMWIEGFKENMDVDIGVGDLYGNQFGLILRLINPSDASKIEERIKSLKEIGMINYFGMQRFGSCGTKTHMIGLKILKGRWKQIVQELLLQDAKDEVVNKLKLDCYNNEQFAKAERQLSNKYKIEKNLFKGLKRYGKNYQNVFESMPRTIRTLYPHSLQSYLWNRIVSRRIKQQGLKVCQGDIVGKKLTGFKLASVELEQEAQKQQNNLNNQNNEGKNQDQELLQQVEELEEQQKYEVELITKQNMQKYAITDIVMPLFGPMINLPKQSFAYSYIKQQFQALGLSEQDFGQNSKKLCFKGMYRKMIVRPPQVQYKIISHANQKDQVQSPFYLIGEEVVLNEGQRRAVQIVLQLPKSSYATMAIRQVLHVGSSFDVQMQLNKLYESQQHMNNHAQKQIQQNT